MNLQQKLFGLVLVLMTLSITGTILTEKVSATGISVDAGLTPAENRLIFRTQIRFMERNDDPSPMPKQMQAYMWPVVVAYGVRSDLAVMVRQIVRKNEMIMAGNSSSKSGLTDLLILGKYRLARVNTPGYSFGVAPTLGLEIPSGNDGFGSNSWDLHLGFFASGRMRSWGVDLSTSYIWNGLATTRGATSEPGDEFSVESAIAYQFGLGSRANFALAPVVELSYQSVSSDSKDGNDNADTGESVLLLSPGLKVTWSSFILEGLIQLPVWQAQNGLQPERAPGFLIGVRLMN